MIYVYKMDGLRLEYPEADDYYTIEDGFVTIFRKGWGRVASFRCEDCKKVEVVDDVSGRVGLADDVDEPPTS
jgi:hypothetical protein